MREVFIPEIILFFLCQCTVLHNIGFTDLYFSEFKFALLELLTVTLTTIYSIFGRPV